MTGLEKTKLDVAVLKMIVGDMQPFSIVEHRGFKELVALLAPNYALPSRTNLSHAHLERKYDEMKGKVAKILSQVEAVCLTTDIWTARTMQPYINIT